MSGSSTDGARVRHSKREGFSLLVVLLIAIVGFAIVGVSMQLTTAFSGAGRIASASSVKYNFLQDAVESGKAQLKRRLDNDNPPPRYTDKSGISETTPIDDSGMLILEDGLSTRALTRSDLGRLGIEGSSGNLSVAIYDMQYDPERVSDSSVITDEEITRLPTSIIITTPNPWNKWSTTLAPDEDEVKIDSKPANTGAYLIRATLDVEGNESRLEAAVFQSNNIED